LKLLFGKDFHREGQKNRVSANVAIKIISEFREEHKLGNKEENEK